MVLSSEYSGWVWHEQSPWFLRIVSVGAALLILAMGFWFKSNYAYEAPPTSGSAHQIFTLGVNFVIAQSKPINEIPEAEAEASVSNKVFPAQEKPVVENLERQVEAKEALPIAKKSEVKQSEAIETMTHSERVVEQSKVEENTVVELESSEKNELDVVANDLASVSPNVQSQQGVHNDVVLNPRFREQPIPPAYPRIARKRGQEGVVWLDIWLDEKGEQIKLEISNSSGVSQLDKAAKRAVEKWAFEPRYIAGLASPSRVRVPIEFSLN